MEVKELSSTSGYQVHLHIALQNALEEYTEAWNAVSQQPPLTEDAATAELTLLHYALEQRRVVVLLLAASCVEAVANFCLACIATPEQFAALERATFLEKWSVLPSLFMPDYSMPRDRKLFQDLKLLHARRNALMHLKERVSVAGVLSSPGVTPERAGDEHAFVARCATLVDRLLSHLCSFDKRGVLSPVVAILGLANGFVKYKRDASSLSASKEGG